MKIICLNTWGCKVPEIFDFVENNSNTDVFCFQEILKGGGGKTHRGEVKNSFERIDNILSEHTGYFLEYGEGGYYSERSSSLDFKYGIACFVKKNLSQKNLGGAELYSLGRKWNDYSGDLAAGLLQGIKVEEYIIFNTHGLWQEDSNKLDTEARFEQLKIINNFLDKHSGKKIICGDFNVTPDTEFLRFFKRNYKDLVKNFEITTTRSSLYKKDLQHADYIFLDKEIDVEDFYTENVVVSDHLPIVLKIKNYQ